MDLYPLLLEALQPLDRPLPRMVLPGDADYDQARQLFNRKFDWRPAAIVYPESACQVSALVRLARRHPTEIPLRLRSGGHDHEGESSGNGALLLDCSAMQDVRVEQWLDDGSAIVCVGAGLRFIDLKARLDALGLGIAHGTCSTVGVTGYTLGGGWGPWTRRYGMGCERLIGATLVLGDGEVVHPSSLDDPHSRNDRLLWALRGGGGMSYGVVTELRFHAFALPPQEALQSFQASLDHLRTRKALRRWEDCIAGDANPALLGACLKISARRLAAGEAPCDDARLPCALLGFYQGTQDEVRGFVRQHFGRRAADSIVFDVGSAPWLFEHWDGRASQGEEGGLGAIVLETPGPAPHKITSRVVDGCDWGEAGRKAFVRSMQSPRAAALGGEEADFHVHTYATLLAISGPFYARGQFADRTGCAFPYQDRPYIIQYQAWWDQYLDMAGQPLADADTIRRATLQNRHHSNLAEDWIAHGRSVALPGTRGAFISFKDAAVPTADYFCQHYHALREVKLRLAQDPDLLLQTAKTVV